MKKLGLFAMLLSLGLFSFGCSEGADEPPAADPGPDAGEPADPALEDAGTE